MFHAHIHSACTPVYHAHDTGHDHSFDIILDHAVKITLTSAINGINYAWSERSKHINDISCISLTWPNAHLRLAKEASSI